MGKSLLEALQEKGLVDPKDAAKVEADRRAELKQEESGSERMARSRGYADEERRMKDERWMRGAAREGRNASSRVGTKQYFDRFKK